MKKLSELTVGDELDMMIGRIVGLSNIGYYRRVSQYNTVWEECEKGAPSAFGVADYAYYCRKENDLSTLFALPKYSSRIEDAMSALQLVVGYTGYCEMRFEHGEWMVCLDSLGYPEDVAYGNTLALAICRAVVANWEGIEKKP